MGFNGAGAWIAFAAFTSGGRMIDNIITNTMLPAISLEVLNRSISGEVIKSATVDVADGEFTYAVT
jgi:type VI secretion system protein VasG